MKKNIYLTLGFLALFSASFYLTGCLNDANLIPASCYDGILNQDEVMTDCGGVCVACDPCLNGVWDYTGGQEEWVDCGGDCETPCEPCFNGIQDPGEDGIDCGLICGVMCDDLCNDGLPNGQEDAVLTPTIGQYAHTGMLGVIGIDCGGVCEDLCPACDDLEMNGDEIGIDCGGEFCANCPEDVDCTNGVMDGDEWMTDFGGCCCPIDPEEFYLRWKEGSVQHEASLGTIQTQIAGNGAIVISGTSLNNHQIAITMTPSFGSAPGQEQFPAGMAIPFPEDGDNAAILKFIVYDDNTVIATNELYESAEVEAPNDANSVFNVIAANTIDVNNYIQGEFTCTVQYTDGGSTFSKVITNGEVFVQIPL